MLLQEAVTYNIYLTYHLIWDESARKPIWSSYEHLLQSVISHQGPLLITQLNPDMDMQSYAQNVWDESTYSFPNVTGATVVKSHIL